MKIRWDFEVMTDEELQEWLHFAEEYRCRKYLKKIKKEMNRRICYA